MPHRVFVTGASGFVGSAVVDELLVRGHAVTTLVNRRLVLSQVRSVKGSLFNPASLDEGMKGCDAVIHLVGIIMEKRRKGITFERIHHQGTRNVVDAARRAGIGRYLHMSALGSRPNAVSTYHKTKYKAEEYVRSSGLDWTIFRPSLIHGPKGEFMQLEAGWARYKSPPFLFMPYFGAGAFGRGGAGKLQPIYVRDVARAFVDALENPKTLREVYPIAGPDQLTWPELHHISSTAIIGHPRAAVAIPVWYAKLITSIAPAFLLPFNRDQVIMSQEDNTADITKFTKDFGWSPVPFEPTLRQYASTL